MQASTDSAANFPAKPVSRAELYDLAWREPMLRIAERFGVSSSYLARVFTELRVPRPERGYWAKLLVGKEPPKPALPPARPGELTEWKPGASVGTATRTVVKAKHKAIAEAASDHDDEPKTIPNKKRLAKQHELLVGVRPHFLKTRRVENGILRPYKRMLVDVMSSEALLEKTLGAAQVLFDELNGRGFHVGLITHDNGAHRAEVDLFESPLSRNGYYHRTLLAPDRVTATHIKDVAIGLTLFEMTEEAESVYVGDNTYLPVKSLTEQQLRRFSGPHYWRSKKEQTTGRLCLQAYCVSRLVKWSKRWSEIKPGSFHSMVPGIVTELDSFAPSLAVQLREALARAEEEHRCREEQHRLWTLEQNRVRQEKANQDAKRDLLVIISAWDEGRRINHYFTCAEEEINRLPDNEATNLRERLDMAKKLIGLPDPLAALKAWRAPGERQ